MLSWANPVDGHRHRLCPAGELIGWRAHRRETAGYPSVARATRKVRHDGHAALIAELFSSTM